MKRFLKIFTIICLGLLTLGVSACESPFGNKEEEISVAEGYAAVKVAAIDTLKEATGLSLKCLANFEAKVYDNDEDKAAGKLTETSGTIDLCLQAKANSERIIDEQCVWIKIDSNEAGKLDNLTIESYLKDGYRYTFSNLKLFNKEAPDYYQYEAEEATDTFDIEDIDLEEVSKYIDDFQAKFPEPVATTKNGEIILKWNINSDNIIEYITAFNVVFNGDDEAEARSKAEEDLEGIDLQVNKGNLTLRVKDNQIASLALELDAEYEGQSVKVSFDISVAYNTFAMSYPLERMEEIKEAYLAKQEPVPGEANE